MDPARLADVEEIKQLKARYFRLMDTRQWAAWGEVFARKGRLQYGEGRDQAVEGRDEIVAFVSEVLREAVTVHHGHMPEIEITGPDTARGIWAMFDLVDHPAYELRGYGHYEEEYVREEGRWRIASSRLTRLRRDFQRKSTPSAP